MQTETANAAQVYAHEMAQTLQAWGYLADAWTESDQDPRAADLATRWNATHRERLTGPPMDNYERKIWRIAAELAIECEVWKHAENETPPVRLWEENDVLESYALARVDYSQSGLDIREVVYVLTIGGPHCEVRSYLTDDRLEVLSYWGSDRGRAVVYCEAIADAMREYAMGLES